MLTTKEQPEQSRELVVVTVDPKTVLVASNGSSKTGFRVVHVWAWTLREKIKAAAAIRKFILMEDGQIGRSFPQEKEK